VATQSCISPSVLPMSGTVLPDMKHWTASGRSIGYWVGVLLLVLGLSGCAPCGAHRTRSPGSADEQWLRGVIPAAQDCTPFPSYWSHGGTVWRPFAPECAGCIEGVEEGIPSSSTIEEIPSGTPLKPSELDWPESSKATWDENRVSGTSDQPAAARIDSESSPSNESSLSDNKLEEDQPPAPPASRSLIQHLSRPPERWLSLENEHAIE